jgi:hypothetical protein
MSPWWGTLIARGAHPDEASLVVAALDPGATPGEDVARHLATCRRCRAVADRAVSLLAEARAQAEHDADEVFTEAVLDRQRAHVMRRLEQNGHPARVLPFPAPSLAFPGTSQVVRRWVAAAAAAGLLVGALAGRFVTLRQEGRLAPVAAPAMATAAPRSQAAPAAAAVTTADDRSGDEAFLVELEVARSPRIEPLQALDAMTPRINEYRREPR